MIIKYPNIDKCPLMREVVVSDFHIKNFSDITKGIPFIMNSHIYWMPIKIEGFEPKDLHYDYRNTIIDKIDLCNKIIINDKNELELFFSKLSEINDNPLFSFINYYKIWIDKMLEDVCVIKRP